MRNLVLPSVLAALAAAALPAIPARANPRPVNGQIAFSRFEEPDTAIFTVNPDGSHERALATQPPLPTPNECPHWSPDGTLIATCGAPDGGATVIIDPDNGTHRELADPDPTLKTACAWWSPNGERLACELADEPADPNRNGIYTIRASDGGGLTRMTENPGGHDTPGDYSPNGRRFVFARSDANGDPVGLFVINANRTGLKQITPTGTLVTDGVGGNWSPHGNRIVFSRHLTADVHSSLWLVHSDGTGLHQLEVQGVACGGANDDPDGIGCFDPRWSPDGTRIAFGISSPEGRNIYTVSADGSDPKQASHGGEDDSPDWGTHPAAG
jgi:Tol biopolymer transport system component